MLGGPQEAEGLSDAVKLLFGLESPTVYFCLTCGRLAAAPETNQEECREAQGAFGHEWEVLRRGGQRRGEGKLL